MLRLLPESLKINLTNPISIADKCCDYTHLHSQTRVAAPEFDIPGYDEEYKTTLAWQISFIEKAKLSLKMDFPFIEVSAAD